MKQTLYTAHARIAWNPQPRSAERGTPGPHGAWSSHNRGGAIRLLPIGQPPGGVPPAKPEIDEPLWREVVGLAPAFRGNLWPQVWAFYARHGGLLEPEARLAGAGGNAIEPWELCREILGWLERLTELLELVRKGASDDLRGLFAPSAGENGPLPLVLYRPSPTVEGYTLQFRGFRRVGNRGDSGEFTLPETGRELLAAAWSVVVDGIAEEMSRISVRPVPYKHSLRSNAPIVWELQSEGALRAGFLDWYFCEVVGFGPSRCAASDCLNLVPPRRQKFCSRQCADRERQRRHRA